MTAIIEAARRYVTDYTAPNIDPFPARNALIAEVETAGITPENAPSKVVYWAAALVAAWRDPGIRIPRDESNPSAKIYYDHSENASHRMLAELLKESPPE